MESFFDKIVNSLSIDQIHEPVRESVPSKTTLAGECVCIIDLAKKQLVYNSGFKDLLGYHDDQVDFDFLFKGYHHEDIDLVKGVIKGVLSSIFKSACSDPDLKFAITFRRKRIDGSYLHLLSETKVYELDANGYVLKVFTRLLDISFLNLSRAVNWSIRSRIIDNQDIHHSVQEFFKIPFTNREIEVIKEIEKGGSNRDIGRRLCLSHHTIATHRKNIFRKSNCNSVLELMVYCRRLDIL